MTAPEWESLCDGCGKCCLEKLEDRRSGEVSYTNVACRLLDVGTCRCSRYAERRRFVPNCEQLDADNVRRFDWLAVELRLSPAGGGARPAVVAPPGVRRPRARPSGRRFRTRPGGAARGGTTSSRVRSTHHIVTWPA